MVIIIKYIIKAIKKISFSILLLYTYNLIASNLNIPINYVTISIISLLDLPGLSLLAIILKLFY